MIPDVMPVLAGALGMFMFVFVGGFLLPIPHDAVVMLAGYYASASDLDPAIAVIVSVLAVLSADSLMYGVSRLGGPLFRRFAARVPTKTLTALADRFRARAGWTIFLARFVMGVRLAVPIISGSTRYPWWRFFFFDAAAVVIYVPAFFFAGYLLHSRIAAAIHGLTTVEHVVIAVTIVAVAAVLAVYVEERYRRRTKNAPGRGRDGRHHSNIAR